MLCCQNSAVIYFSTLARGSNMISKTMFLYTFIFIYLFPVKTFFFTGKNTFFFPVKTFFYMNLVIMEGEECEVTIQTAQHLFDVLTCKVIWRLLLDTARHLFKQCLHKVSLRTRGVKGIYRLCPACPEAFTEQVFDYYVGFIWHWKAES